MTRRLLNRGLIKRLQKQLARMTPEQWRKISLPRRITVSTKRRGRPKVPRLYLAPKERGEMNRWVPWAEATWLQPKRRAGR